MPIPGDGPIAFLCAMPMELRPLRKPLSLQRSDVGDGKGWRGSFRGREVVAVQSGMGTKLATAATERLLDAATPDWLLVVGITGAIENDTPIGTLVMPEVVTDSATGEEHPPAPLGDHTAEGTMWTTDELLTDLDHLAGLRRRGVVSLDMETSAVAAVCEARGVPWSVFRAISDRASDGTVDQELFALSNQDGSPNPGAVARYVLRHPGSIRHLARMGRGAKLATEVAAKAALRALD